MPSTQIWTFAVKPCWLFPIGVIYSTFLLNLGILSFADRKHKCFACKRQTLIFFLALHELHKFIFKFQLSLSFKDRFCQQYCKASRITFFIKFWIWGKNLMKMTIKKVHRVIHSLLNSYDSTDNFRLKFYFAEM